MLRFRIPPTSEAYWGREAWGWSSVAYLAQLLRVLVQLLQDGQGLLLGAVLQNALDHPAAIRVGGQHKNLEEDTQE